MDSGRRQRKVIFSSIAFLVVATLSVFLVWQLRPLIMPILLGVLMAYIFRPLKSAFKYRWLPNGLRVALLLTGLTLSLLFSVNFVKNSIPDENEKIALMVRLKYKFNEKLQKVFNYDPATGKGNMFYNYFSSDINSLQNSLNKYLELSDEQHLKFIQSHAEKQDPIYQYYLEINKHKALNHADKAPASVAEKENAYAEGHESSLILSVMDTLSIWFLFPIVFMFLLMDDGSMLQNFVRLIPNRYFELTLTVLEEVDEAIGNYLRGMSLDCALVGFSLALGFFLIGVDYQMSLIIGILSGIGTAIPFLGPVIGLGFGLTYALVIESISPVLPFVDMDNLFLAVIVVNVVVLLLDNLVFQPVVLGSATDLHPLIVIVGIMAGSMIFGMAGVLFAIPAIVVFKAVAQHAVKGLKDYRII